MTDSTCLNCEKELTDNFCAGCGQKAATHRITFTNFLFHDLLHGTFHIEKGMLFTARQALFRPGIAALEYISGKRKRYYNVFYLILITMGIVLFLGHYYQQLEIYTGNKVSPHPPFLNDASRKLNQILDHVKIINCLLVPFGAINSFIIFRRKKLNLAEHAIISGMALLGILLISLLGNLFFYLNLIWEFNTLIASIYGNSVILLILLYLVYAYYNAFGPHYSKLGFSYRILVFYAMLTVEACFLLWLAIGYVTEWQFYSVNIVGLFG